MRIFRTTISCVAIAMCLVASPVDLGADALTFPLSAAWTARLDAPPAFAPAYDATRVYVSLKNGHLVSVSLASGEPVWAIECPTSAAPAAGDGSVFVGGEGFVEARSAADGTPQWRASLDGRVTLLHWDTGWLMVTTSRGTLSTLRAADGEVLWTRALTAALQSPPSVAGERLYLSLDSGELLALGLQTGDPAWTTRLPKPGNEILALEDRLFVGSLDNNFYSLSARNGGIAWRWRTGADVIGMAAIDLKHVYFVSLDNVLRALDRRNGSLRWMKSLPTRPTTGPLLSGDLLIVAGIATELHAYAASNGDPRGELVVKTPEGQEMQFVAPPHLAGDRLVFVTKGGQVQALGSAPPEPAAPPELPAVPEPPAAPDPPASDSTLTP